MGAQLGAGGQFGLDMFGDDPLDTISLYIAIVISCYISIYIYIHISCIISNIIL